MCSMDTTYCHTTKGLWRSNVSPLASTSSQTKIYVSPSQNSQRSRIRAFIILLTSQGELGTERLYILAELYRHEGDILLAQNRTQEAIFDYQRALFFYLQLPDNQKDQDSSKIKQKITELFIKLEKVNLPVEILYQLFDFFERNGEFALIQDVITRMLHSPEVDSQIITDLITYYERLLENSAADWSSGSLSRAQVEQNLERLKNWGI